MELSLICPLTKCPNLLPALSATPLCWMGVPIITADEHSPCSFLSFVKILSPCHLDPTGCFFSLQSGVAEPFLCFICLSHPSLIVLTFFTAAFQDFVPANYSLWFVHRSNRSCFMTDFLAWIFCTNVIQKFRVRRGKFCTFHCCLSDQAMTGAQQLNNVRITRARAAKSTSNNNIVSCKNQLPPPFPPVGQRKTRKRPASEDSTTHSLHDATSPAKHRAVLGDVTNMYKDGEPALPRVRTCKVKLNFILHTYVGFNFYILHVISVRWWEMVV